MSIIYADVSGWQKSINWPAYCGEMKQQGMAIAAIKASEGTNFVDTYLQQNRDGAINAGIDKLIYYHYARNDKGNNPMDEAHWLHSVVGDIRPQDLIMLDMEVVSGDVAGWSLAWLEEVERLYGKPPVLYSYDAFIRAHLQDQRLSKYPLITAHYTYDENARPACPPPWTSYLALQYTDKANIPGITGPCDANVWLGEESMSIDINTPGVSDFFTEQDSNHWHCKQKDKIVQYGILSFYKSDNGLLRLGLPDSNEIPLDANGNVKQHFERGVVFYDPHHVYDFPHGSGPVYYAHLYNGGPGEDPMIAQLKQQIATLQAQVADPDHSAADKLAQIKTIVNS